ncbi:MAG: type II methionyl aminopeptidase [Methanoregulaceae archaeon]|nr:type II methionyl aminopeptidase [Methanoregulaceae archaeon]
MNEEIYSYYRDAGEIASSILQRGAGEIRREASYRDVVEHIEDLVAASGAGLAFPLNVSINAAAAHDTASSNEERLFRDGDVVKLDLGVHIEGYIADCATTVDLGKNDLLLDASKEALRHAILLARSGVATGDLGAAIQKEIEERGYRPIANLGGHGLDRFVIHKPPNIPNIGMAGGAVLEEGMIIAIEPFASTGSGFVSEQRKTEIYSQTISKPVRLPQARRVLEEIRPRRGLPFARRWLHEKKLDIVLPNLVKTGLLHPYPVLADIPGSLVSQHEHTLIITDDEPIVTTR